MKKKYLTIVFVLFFGFTYSQKKEQPEKGTILRVEPSGVVVYKPIDVEQTLGITSKPIPEVKKERSKPKTIQDLSLEELKEMLYYVELKIDNTDSSEDLINYSEQRKLIIDRIKSIEKVTK